MSKHLILDAMIARADFWQGSAPRTESSRPPESITFENLKREANFALNLRKPDFQRETNKWTINQAISFIQSFIEGELVPSIILWLSPEGFNFVIDGAHRLSALRAWMEDDYGDGHLSIQFFGGEIPAEQKRLASRMRTAVNSKIGSFKSLQDRVRARAESPEIVYDDLINKRLRNLARRLDLQWVGGDAEVAESSFFKINTQGTPLDKTEEALLKSRRKAAAVAARSIIRAATGHKYWSKFPETERKEIESLAQQINRLLFQPEISSPIRTLLLPIGGSSSNIDALSVLVRLISITDGTQTRRSVPLDSSPDDSDGKETIKTLRNCLETIKRITGPDKGSLGLHPFVYFYTDRGKYVPEVFLGIAILFKSRIVNNDSNFFKKYTDARSSIEEFLLKNKSLIAQILVQIGSRTRAERVADIFTYMVKAHQEGAEITIEGVANAARLKGSIIALREKVESQNFSEEASSSVFLTAAVKTLLKCPICNGYLEPALSSSVDHITRKSEGGLGTPENGQLTHFFCNTGVKG